MSSFQTLRDFYLEARGSQILSEAKLLTLGNAIIRASGEKIDFNVKKGVAHVMKQVRKNPEWIRYAGNPIRGEYRGFGALHDKCDANMLLPYSDSENLDIILFRDDYIDFCNAVTTEVGKEIIRLYKKGVAK